jgi:hypothetical protein
MTAGRPESASETYTFVCGDCGHTWEALFRVTSFTGPGGSPSRAYIDERGRVLTTPLARADCPGCGGRQVHVLPAELAARARAAEHAVQEGHGHHPHVPHLRPSSPRREAGGPSSA